MDRRKGYTQLNYFRSEENDKHREELMKKLLIDVGEDTNLPKIPGLLRVLVEGRRDG